MRILVVEDDRKVASFIHDGLVQEGYAVDVLHDGSQAGEQAQVYDYDPNAAVEAGYSKVADYNDDDPDSRCCATSARARRRCRC